MNEGRILDTDLVFKWDSRYCFFVVVIIHCISFFFTFSGPGTTNEVTADFTNGYPTGNQYARESKISEDSFDDSSTSSGDCYENTTYITGQSRSSDRCHINELYEN